MPIEIQRGRSQWFYGRITVDGLKKSFNLGVKIEGRIPDTLDQEGDAAFERSRSRAQVAFEKVERDIKQRGKAEELLQQIHEIRTGARVKSIPLVEMVAAWKSIRRKKPLSAQYVGQCESKVQEFTALLADRFPKVKEMADIQPSMATVFMNHEDDRGIAAKTSNNTLILLRSVFEALRKEAGLSDNPFQGIPTRDEDTIHRKPFTVS